MALDVRMFHNEAWKDSPIEWCSIQEIRCNDLRECEKYHFHDADQYYLVARGELAVLLDNQKFRVGKGDVVAIPYGSHHQILSQSNDVLFTVITDGAVGKKRKGLLDSPTPRSFIGLRGRYEDGMVRYYDVPSDRCAIVPERTWFWLKQKPKWSRLTAFGVMYLHGESVPDYHKHDYYEVYICSKGTIEVYADGKTYLMTDGDILAIDQACPHMLVQTPDDGILSFFNGEPYGEMRYGHQDFEE